MQLTPLGKKSGTQGGKGRSLKLMSPMLFGTITKTWVGWIGWTKILASKESLSTLRNDFRREVVNIYHRKYSSQQRGVGSVGRQILVTSRKLVKVPEPVRFDGHRHYPASNLTQRSCPYCGMKVKFIYKKSIVGLHNDCFSAYDNKQ